jgi:uncharacterized membrane protein YkvA (DUF1232 family)
MTELDTRCLDAFPAWLRSLGDDVRAVAGLVQSGTSVAARRPLTGALNYLFKSLDLIPDGIEDLGFIDDAFVLRVAAASALAADAAAAEADTGGALARLAGDARLVEEFLAGDFPRMRSYVATLDKAAARGRSVEQIMNDPALRAEVAREAFAWADSYTAPGFGRDEKNLVKLRAFLSAKLPS